MAIGLKIILFSLIVIVGFCSESKAASQVECAIWLCLPGGFPTGCSDAYSAFKSRIKKGKPPLPDLSSCTTGPDGKTSTGRYQMGYEYFEPCRAGYTLKEQGNEYLKSGKCIQTNCERYQENICPSYEAIRRPKPRYVKMWVDSSYIGQFFY